MRYVLLLLGLLAGGCGGYLVVHAPVDPEAAPRSGPVVRTSEVSYEEAVHIAKMEAHRRGFGRLFVDEVELKKQHWEVQLTSDARRRHKAEVKVKVDRYAARVLSFKSEDEEEDD